MPAGEQVLPYRSNIPEISKLAREGRVTLLYGAKDARHNNAVALKSVLEDVRGK